MMHLLVSQNYFNFLKDFLNFSLFCLLTYRPQVLEFDVSPPTSHLFCSKLSAMAGSDPRTTSFAMYLNELTLMSASFLRYSPSLTAAASVALAR